LSPLTFTTTHSFRRATRRRCFLLASCCRREYSFGHDTRHNPHGQSVIVCGGFPPFPKETSLEVEGAAGYNDVCPQCELSNKREVSENFTRLKTS
jgi:hypothetical protein